MTRNKKTPRQPATGRALSLRRIWMEWRSFAMLVLLLFSFRSVFADWNDVPTGSMQPSIMIGDRVFVNKLAYDLKIPFTKIRLGTWSHPKRGDVVVFQSPHDGKRLVKRVIGVPGDRVALRHNRLYVNDKPAQYAPGQRDDEGQPIVSLVLQETYEGKTHPVMITPGATAFHNFPETVVPEDRYFVMGDNRDDSLDSRFFGAVERQRILGRAEAVVFSLDYDDHFLPRGDRFLRDLP